MTAPFLDLVDLASERLGAAVVEANDEFFAPKENLIKPDTPIWMEGKYTERGKWMDGWETRRRRDDGDHDWCIVRLGVRGIVRGVDVDTAFFKGNYPEACAIDLGDGSSWREVLARSALKGHAHNVFAIGAASAATVRFSASKSTRVTSKATRAARAVLTPAVMASIGARCSRKRRCSRTRGTRSRIRCRRSATSHTCGSTFFPTAAWDDCGSMAGRNNATAEGAEIAEKGIVRVLRELCG